MLISSSRPSRPKHWLRCRGAWVTVSLLSLSIPASPGSLQRYGFLRDILHPRLSLSAIAKKRTRDNHKNQLKPAPFLNTCFYTVFFLAQVTLEKLFLTHCDDITLTLKGQVTCSLEKSLLSPFTFLVFALYILSASLLTRVYVKRFNLKNSPKFDSIGHIYVKNIHLSNSTVLHF